MRFPNAPKEYSPDWANQLIRVLDAALRNNTIKNGYTATHSTNRTISTSVSTLAQTQDVLGTLIADLQKKGII